MMTDPRRIRQYRTPGWRLPPGARSVAGTSKYANPYRPPSGARSAQANRIAVWLYTEDLYGYRPDRRVKATVDDVMSELPGRVLACYCPLDLPCHADILLEMANR
jgi:hypothetical protein